ncbi:hypothetical protein CTZ28_13635 [Streptomyces shenzhenensis]|uniref:Glycosyl hydrolase family 32 C-terminal domain-containing protein n=2 Tax=Streptomyces shenzhenensis TaxID=943815 RepID=A0A3M0IAX8_9ACTN|nr:hypothetical protein CTZ28_13635 [Streptomyces shenzhenensis]
MADGVNTGLAGAGNASDVRPGEARRLTFALNGSRLDLYDGDRLVVSAVDPTLIPAAGFVGLHTTTSTGRAKFTDVSVTARADPRT